MDKQSFALASFVTGIVVFVYGLWVIFSVTVTSMTFNMEMSVVPIGISILGIVLTTVGIITWKISTRSARGPEPVLH